MKFDINDLLENVASRKFILGLACTILAFAPGYAYVLYFYPSIFFTIDSVKLTILSSIFFASTAIPIILLFYLYARIFTHKTRIKSEEIIEEINQLVTENQQALIEAKDINDNHMGVNDKRRLSIAKQKILTQESMLKKLQEDASMTITSFESQTLVGPIIIGIFANSVTTGIIIWGQHAKHINNPVKFAQDWIIVFAMAAGFLVIIELIRHLASKMNIKARSKT